MPIETDGEDAGAPPVAEREGATASPLTAAAVTHDFAGDAYVMDPTAEREGAAASLPTVATVTHDIAASDQRFS